MRLSSLVLQEMTNLRSELEPKMEVLTFSHGIHPPEYKEITEDSPIKRLPFPPYLVVLLSQHAGKPAKPIVQEGQEVTRGQLIASDDGFISAPIHAPATGVVRSVSRALDFDGHMAPAIIMNRALLPPSRRTIPQP